MLILTPEWCSCAGNFAELQTGDITIGEHIDGDGLGHPEFARVLWQRLRRSRQPVPKSPIRQVGHEWHCFRDHSNFSAGGCAQTGAMMVPTISGKGGWPRDAPRVIIYSRDGGHGR